MAKHLEPELLDEPLDPVRSREERKATGRMVAVIVALLMIFSGFYHAWIKKIPVLAGVMVPALIMLLYAAWVLFLAKREKQRRLNAENHLRASATALSEVLITESATNKRGNKKSERHRSNTEATNQKPSTSTARHMVTTKRKEQVRSSILKTSADDSKHRSNGHAANKLSKTIVPPPPLLAPLPPILIPLTEERIVPSHVLLRSLSAR